MDYKSVLDSKRQWKISNPTIANVSNNLDDEQDKDLARKLLSKFLALSSLELPVGNFINYYSSKVQSPELKSLLISNSEDEIRHDQQLDSIISAFKSRDNQSYLTTSKEVNRVVNSLDTLSVYVEPVLIAGYLELTLFVPLLTSMRMLGDAAFQIVSNEINRDERVHIQSNFHVVDTAGINSNNPKLNSVRLGLIDLITNHLPEQHDNKYLSRPFWFDVSNKLASSRKCESLKADTNVGNYIAFFEVSNRSLSGGY